MQAARAQLLNLEFGCLRLEEVLPEWQRRQAVQLGPTRCSVPCLSDQMEDLADLERERLDQIHLPRLVVVGAVVELRPHLYKPAAVMVALHLDHFLPAARLPLELGKAALVGLAHL